MKPAKLTAAEVDRAITGMCTRDGGARIDTRREIPTHTPLWRRVWIAVQIAFIRWRIASDEAYLAELAREGITAGANLQAWRDELAAQRVKLAVLEQQ
jgi:hypothetical protein